jgi:uncharacterized membrane protein
MSGIPLHPLVVHFPIVLSVLLPLVVLAAAILGYRTGETRKYWSTVLVLHALLLVSTFVAVRTGENDEEKVEKTLASEVPLESHEEKAEVFLKLTGVALAVSALGLAPGTLGLAGRVLGGAGALGILLLGIQVGHSGGALVYRHGAAAAYASDADGTNLAIPRVAPERKNNNVDEKDDD